MVRKVTKVKAKVGGAKVLPLDTSRRLKKADALIVEHAISFIDLLADADAALRSASPEVQVQAYAKSLQWILKLADAVKARKAIVEAAF